ncbi:Cysteine-rich receptor-like protein kinase 10 [Zea mays]|uniref:Cysteine-rich receptor-like protein kinase 10 n=1 Tax=Zea mays TaxID=4577 RepID=A0A3L6DV25_MAIZE|nr:Cysteine-rich receptor-like protein kinase 10 [Zea mays]
MLPRHTPAPDGATAEYAEYTCNGTTGNFTSGSAFAANLDRLVAELPGNASASPLLFASASAPGSADADTAYGLALCRGDVTDARACSACLADAFSRLRRLCGGDRDATFYADLCTARYSGADFMARPDDNSPVVNGMDANASTYPGWDAANATSRSFFLSLVGTLFGEMSMYGAYNSSRRLATAVMFINAGLPTVYGLAQCTPDLAPAQCWHCFQGLGDLNRQWYDGREGGRVSGVRCSFRYEGYQFYQGTPDVRIGLHGGPSSSPDDDGTSASNHKKVLIIALVVPIALVCGVLVAGLLLVRAQRKRAAGNLRARNDPGKTRLPTQTHSRNSSKTEEALKLWRIEESSSEFTLYDFAELAVATADFSDDNLLGKGGFGPGKLADGAEVAVKRLAAHSGQGLEEFKNEIQLIAKLQHTNLVRLLGCCVQEEEKMLVYEYMPNRSLDCFIFDQQRGPLLDWEKRRRIIEGIAQGLLYLHRHSRAWQLWREGRAFELIDPTLGECAEVADIVRCVKVALLCVQDSATDRPTMTDVTAMLASRAGGAAASLPDPRRPPHFSLRVSSSDDGSSEVRTRSHGTASCSTNDLTITTVQEGR